MTQEQERVLGKLSNGRILQITDSKDGTINFMEMCDQYFAVDLTHDELGHFIDYLAYIYNSTELKQNNR